VGGFLNQGGEFPTAWGIFGKKSIFVFACTSAGL
jgi:hypothetical protein